MHAEVLDTMGAGVILSDLAGVVIYANAAAATVLGMRPHECAGVEIQSLLMLSLAESLGPNGEGEGRREVRFTNGNGERHYLGVTVRSFRPNGTHAGYVLLFRALVRDGLPDEATMRHMERLASIGQMVAGFAHEVRNPLAALRALTDDLAMETPESDPRIEHVKRISRNVNRIEELLRTSLQFGRPARSSLARHSPAALVRSATDLLRPRLKQFDLPTDAVHVEVESGVRDVMVDDGQMVQMLVILLNNAIDATNDPTKIMLRVYERMVLRGKERVTRVFFDVEDAGPGIPADRLAQIFDAFYTTKDAGTGLGLSIALKLVRENGGQISVRSEVGEGTLFTIEMPGAEA